MSIYVSNLSSNFEENDLRQIFSEHGFVKKIQVYINQKTSVKKGFVVVEMETGAEEAAAIRELRGTQWMGRYLKVNRAKTEYTIS
ncbi:MULTISPECIES: RNA recognition motif domain-containing protein [Nostocales]|uniref:RNA-binding protein n=3 Tax=Nostocales TaxID=1161 RepID=A0A0C1N3M2_9CYAN|nr:RNA-binding protein [Tolypothrix bouteillei]KAF3889567.1 RNA-binding protein [Tolypothrix bouteillei VB521301]